MSSIYNGKIYFTEHDLTTKYDKLNIRPCKYDNSKSSYLGVSNLNFNKTNVYQNLNNKSIFNSNEDLTKKNISVDGWMNLDVVDDFHISNNLAISNSSLLKPKSSNCVLSNSKNCFSNTDIYKMDLANLVLNSVPYDIKKLSSNINLFIDVAKEDPEFILKVSLYCRKELNVRSISNYLVGIAAFSNESRPYLTKYFRSIVNLPTDWLEVVYHYMLISNSSCLPNQLKKALVTKFMDFSVYQLGKYRGKKMIAEVNGKKIKLSLKNIVRILHICKPVENVMSLLGKRYPMTKDGFFLSKLPDQWDESRAGKRMKIPTPDTWETQISMHGNKPEIWQKLIDNKSLPYMATVRNLRNLLQSNIKDHYHTKVAHYIAKESNVINGKLLPFQYFTANKILEEYNETILKAQEKLIEKGSKLTKNNKQKVLDRKTKIRNAISLQKASQRQIVSENIIKSYTDALNTAIEISTLYNIPPIRGKILILANLNESAIYSPFKYGSSKSVKEVIALVTSMCYAAGEATEIYLVKDILVNKFQRNTKYKSILKMSSDILSDNEQGKITVSDLIDEMIASQFQFDMILSFDVNIPEKCLLKYIKFNPSVLIMMNSLNTSLMAMNYKSPNIIRMDGFNEHTIKIIAEFNNGNIIKRIDYLDEKYSLINTEEFINCKPLVNDSFDFPDTIQNEINIFISSTFVDMEKERTIINKIIAPSVKRNILLNVTNSTDINVIDLRWGVPVHWGQSEKLLQYCIEQVKRCHIFIGILGSRYGWIPDPKIIRNLSEIYPELKNYEGLSVTNIEYHFASKSCRKIFLLKSARVEDLDHCQLKSFREKIIANECYYEFSNESILSDFKILVPWLNEIIMEKITVQNEITNSILSEAHDQQTRYKIISKETSKFLKSYTENIESFQKEEADELLLILEKKLSFEFDIHSSVNCHSFNTLKSVEKKENELIRSGGILIIQGKPGSGKTSIMSELICQYNRKYSELTKPSSNHSTNLNFVWIYDVIKFINTEKSSDLYLFDLLHDIIEFLIYNFPLSIKNYIRKELQAHNEIKSEEFWRPINLKHALLIWNLILKKMFFVKNLYVTIFIDGIDNLKDFSEVSTLAWIPLILPPKFRIIMTTLFNSNLSASSKFRNNSLIHEIRPISISQKRKVIENLFKKIGKTLQSNPFDNYMSYFLMKRDSNNPMYIKIAINHLALNTKFNKVKEEIDNLPSTLDNLIIHTLKAIEKEIPREICFVMFSFLIYSKAGFTIEDLQMLMSIYFRVSVEKNKLLLTISYLNDFKLASNMPLCFSMYPIVYIKNQCTLLLDEDKRGRILLKNSFIKNLITKYTMSIDKTAVHCVISIYCDAMLKFDDKLAFRDIVYYKFKSHLFEECAALLTNIQYLKRRFDLGMGEGLLTDYNGFEGTDIGRNKLWLDICSRPEYKDFKTFISENFTFLFKYPTFFMQQAINESKHSQVNFECKEIKFVPFDFSNTNPVILKKNKAFTDKSEIDSLVYYLSDQISHVSFGSILNLISVSYGNGLIQLFKLNQFEALLNLRRHFSRVKKTYFYNDDTRLISVGEDGLALVWSSSEGALLRELKGHLGPVTDCTVSKKANVICTVGLDSQLIVWKNENFILDRILKMKSPINCITAHPTNDFKVIIGCWNGNMFIYNLSNYKKVAVIHNNKSTKAIVFHPHYDLFLSSTITGEMNIWSSINGTKLKMISLENKNYFSNIQYSSDGLQFYEFGAYQSPFFGINIWSTAFGYNSKELNLLDVSCIDANDQFIVCGTKYGQVSILDGNFAHKLQKYVCNSELTSICLEKSDEVVSLTYFVTVDYERTIYLIQIDEDNILIKKIESLHSRPVNVIYLLPHYIISGSDDCSIGLLKLKNYEFSRKSQSIINIFLDSILTIDVCKSLILVGCKDGSIGLIKIKGFIVLNYEIKAHDDWITTVRFNSVSYFMSGSNDFTIKLWEINMIDTSKQYDTLENSSTFKLLHVIANHNGPITSISVNNDNTFASSSQDGTIKLWNMSGLFLENIILGKHYSDESEELTSIRWAKFLSVDYLLVLNASSTLYGVDFKKSCLITKMSKHLEPVVSVFDSQNELFTISVDGAVRKSSFHKIFQKNMIQHQSFKITHSIYFSSILELDNLIVAISDLGKLMLFSKNYQNLNWELFETFDIKQHYDAEFVRCEFPTPFLQCSCFKRYGKYEVLMKFGKSLFVFDLYSMSLKSVNNDPIDFVEDSDLELSNIRQMIEEEITMEIMQTDDRIYLIRFTEKARVLELLSTKHNEQNLQTLSKISTSGIPCHIMTFRNSYQELEVLISYLHGNADIFAFKQLLL